MTQLEFRLFGNATENVFAINGQTENSATVALGWTLSRCPELCRAFLKNLTKTNTLHRSIAVQVQLHGKEDRGFTDIEIISDGLHLIVEAKKEWKIPSIEQLRKYANRISPSAAQRLIVSLSASSQQYAKSRLPQSVRGVAVVHRSWSDLHKLVVRQKHSTRNGSRLWLQELEKHLKGYVSMQDPKDNSVFVVSLSNKEVTPGSGCSWIEIVEKARKYFHRIGNHWPVLPPNYIGFRYGGVLRSVHHIRKHVVVHNLASIDSRWPTTDSDQFVYELGPAMRPAKEIRNGHIWPNGRYICAIDTLLSGEFKTISDAHTETKRRLERSAIG